MENLLLQIRLVGLLFIKLSHYASEKLLKLIVLAHVHVHYLYQNKNYAMNLNYKTGRKILMSATTFI